MLNKFLVNQRGAGIILVLIVCSLVGAAALYLMDMSKVSEEKLSIDAKVQSYKNLVKIVATHVHSGNTCTTALKQTVLTSDAFSTKGQSIQLNLNLPMNRKVLKAPVGRDVWFLNGGTSIRDVLLFVNERVRAPVRKAKAGSPLWVGAKGYILIIPGHPGVGAQLSRGRVYRIPIFLYYSGSAGSKVLESCFDPAGDAFFCTVTGAAYDVSATTEEMRCQPDRSCFSYKSGLVESKMNVVTESCPNPYKAQKIGHFDTDFDLDLWLCEWCNENPILPEVTPAAGSFYVPSPPTPFESEKGVTQEPYMQIVNPNSGL